MRMVLFIEQIKSRDRFCGNLVEAILDIFVPWVPEPCKIFY